jgi:poly-gamma-glutamate capsule biosynthesis protein CapA/YwtB (metallophosphatase superfamily)/outer membrane protein assembly factor BamB
VSAVNAPRWWVFLLVALCFLLLIGPSACRQDTPDHENVAEQGMGTVTAADGPCLSVESDLWLEEEEFFDALQLKHPECPADLVASSEEALSRLGSGESEVAIISGSLSESGAALVRREPFVLVSNAASPLDDAPLEWLRGLFGGGGDFRPVVLGEGLAALELLGIEGLDPEALHVSSWAEAKGLVQDRRQLVALLPWREVDFRLRALPIGGGSLTSLDAGTYPYQRRWWLVGDVDKYPELSQELIQGLAVDVEPLVSLVAVGDIMLGRGVGSQIRSHSAGYPFDLTRGLTSQADVAFGNLEGPITTRGVPQGGISLRAEPEVAEALSDAGFDIVSLANNHTDDYGAVGLLDTITYLEGEGIAYVGLSGDGGAQQEAVALEVKSLRLAFLAYNNVPPRWESSADAERGPAWLEPETAYADVRRAAACSDFVVVSLHWGAEYMPRPDEFQQEVARGMLEAGAGLVIGHHPHVVGAVAWEDEGFVAYSLGNFVFDQPFSVETLQGLVLACVIDGTGLKQVRLVPVEMEAGQPAVLPPSEASVVNCEVFENSGMSDSSYEEGRTFMEDDLGREGLEEEWTLSLADRARALRLCDLDGDSSPEITAATGPSGGPSAIHALEADGSLLWEVALQSQVNDLECGDLNNDGKAEVLVATGQLDAAGEIVALDAEGQVRWRFGVEASVLDIALGDADGDGLPEVAAGEWGAFGDTVYLLDADGRLQWKSPTGGSVHRVQVGDLGVDVLPEVIAGAEDVYAFGGTGELLWKYRATSYDSCLEVAGMAGDSSWHVLAGTRYPRASVFALDSLGELLWNLDLEASPATVVSYDGARRAEACTVVGSLDGTVQMLENDGSRRWSSRLSGPVSAISLGDVNADGVVEAVVGTGGCFSPGAVYILNISTGAMLEFHEVGDSVRALQVADTNGQSGDELVIALDGGEVLVLRWTSE